MIDSLPFLKPIAPFSNALTLQPLLLGYTAWGRRFHTQAFCWRVITIKIPNIILNLFSTFQAFSPLENDSIGWTGIGLVSEKEPTRLNTNQEYAQFEQLNKVRFFVRVSLHRHCLSSKVLQTFYDFKETKPISCHSFFGYIVEHLNDISSSVRIAYLVLHGQLVTLRDRKSVV